MKIEIIHRHRVDVNLGGPLFETIVAHLASIIKGQILMTKQFDTIEAAFEALKGSNATLISLTNSIFASLQAAQSAGTGMTDAEVATLVGQITDAKTATDSAVLADTPVVAGTGTST